MSIGIRNIFVKQATQIVTASVVPVDITALLVPISSLQTARIKWWVPFTLGATGGFRFIIASPAAPGTILASLRVEDCTTANTFFEDVQVAFAAFTNASAVAGEYVAHVDLLYTNGANPGNMSLQFAQNNSQATNFTVLGGSVEVTYL
jgi:hypothetical protein